MEGECELVKENKLVQLPLSWRWLCAGLALSVAALCAVASIDYALPTPLTRATAKPDQFIAEVAYEHLINLTSIGPRVAGSYENEVAAVGVLVAAIKDIAAHASPHNRVELDVHRASGGFALSFMDGMNNVYRDVQSVVARVSGVGGGAGARGRTAILLNCHFDTVPDSPGASDDGAGCAVALETLRALAAAPGPLRHDAVLLLNGAEENILQASHAFVTAHRWAKSVRAFINIEACGAGGREVLFQAGPHDPWIVEVYAGQVPHPFASSLAQELFESGLIPADTDFRIFRDFGNLSGVDLAWSANGYVYHTRLDDAAHVPRDALQRTGDNVLALAHGLLASAGVESAPDAESRQPVFFDVVGLVVVSARAPAAALAAAATLALLFLKIHLNARDARKQLYMSYGAWWRVVARGAYAVSLGVAGGVAVAAGVALLLHALGARLTFYSRPLLLAPLYVMPGVCACWCVVRAAFGAPALVRGWWGARALHDALGALAGAALLLCCVRGLRSGFLPLLWALSPPLADAAWSAGRWRGRAAAWGAGAALPLLQTCYLLLNSLHMFVPIMGRAGAGPLPTDVTMAIIASSLVLAALSWMLPFVVATRNPAKLIWGMALVSLASVALVLLTPLGASYSAERPQRLMLFHTRRTVHRGASADVDTFYWVPELDANTFYAVQKYVSSEARGVGGDECGRMLYCGAPYFLPVLSLVGRSYAAPAAAAPLPRLRAALHVRATANTHVLTVDVTQAPQHVVLIVSPKAGGVVTYSNVVPDPIPGAAWGTRKTYFYTLHAARAPAVWHVQLHVSGVRGGGGAGAVADVAVAGHAMFGEHKLQEEHARLLQRLPDTVAATGWGVDLHLYEL